MPRNGLLYTRGDDIRSDIGDRAHRCLGPTHPRCSEKVSRFSEHVDQFFSFQEPLSLCELLTVGALWQQYLRPEFTENLVAAFHVLLLFSF